jgi:aspartyl-tRNA(Asn)/glutamyl-tRNA(Gln) amidotransferase subunit B
MSHLYTPIIGLEIHIELKSKSKMFCSCVAKHFGEKPNIHTCPICLGLPGALPVPNEQAIKWTVTAGLALGCQIPLFSKFDRKNYFYPDLPKGYQISQYDLPLAVTGKLRLSDGRVVRIRRVHLEEDTAKLIHEERYRGAQVQRYRGETLIDFNRAGVPLMEIVTEPDIHSAEEAKEFLKKLRQIIRYLGISDCDMEKGSMRLEPNVSIKEESRIKNQESRISNSLPSYKVEIKNLNSFRFVEKALKYEIERQTRLLDSGQKLTQETRGWDEKRQITVLQRIKEEAKDYRYFPEPDIPPLRWAESDIGKFRGLLPELPDEKISRFQKNYGLSTYQAQILAESRKSADYFEETVRVGKRHQLKPLEIAHAIINKRVDKAKILPAHLIEILLAKRLKPRLGQDTLKHLVVEVIEENPKAIKDYRMGKTNAIMFLVGQVQRKSKGQANPQETRRIFERVLKSR